MNTEKTHDVVTAPLSCLPQHLALSVMNLGKQDIGKQDADSFPGFAVQIHSPKVA